MVDDALLQAAAVVGLFVLRLAVPLAITLAVGYWLRRLDAKWQAAAQAQQEISQVRKEGAVEPELEMYRVIEPPCWEFKKCSESIRVHCPACKHPDIPCWLARRRAEGQLPGECYHCELFSRRRQVVPDLVS